MITVKHEYCYFHQLKLYIIRRNGEVIASNKNLETAIIEAERILNIKIQNHEITKQSDIKSTRPEERNHDLGGFRAVQDYSAIG